MYIKRNNPLTGIVFRSEYHGKDMVKNPFESNDKTILE